jgi:hypothetical protein
MAMGLPAGGWLGQSLHLILRRATQRFSQMFAECDRVIELYGLPEGARFLLSKLVQGFEARGIENIPHAGPLVIASSHPGAMDSVALAATAQRLDLKIIAGAIPFLQNLPNVSKHLIFTSYTDAHSRVVALRESVRHLRAGGALLLFADEHIDPDPSFMPHAEDELAHWSRSLEIFLRRVPQTQVVASIVSNVIDPRYMRHPITWLRRARPDRQRLAMMIQIIQQMLGKKLDLVPRIPYSEMIGIQGPGHSEHSLQIIIDRAKSLLEDHIKGERAGR